jgi:glycerophosphoryl diester phosphodiesterase
MSLTQCRSTGGHPPAVSDIDLQGHRGARGLVPENTIASFMTAMDFGVTTLEMDVAINAQGQAVLSHEPWMSAEICRHPDGEDVEEEEQRELNLYRMSQTEIGAFDCGGRGNARFPRQQPQPAAKPTLREVLQAVAAKQRDGRAPVRFNIEIKSTPDGDGLFHPPPREFATILYDELRAAGILARATVQSFDARALEAIHAIDPDVSTAWLIGERGSWREKLAQLTFRPDIYSPYFELLDAESVRGLQAEGLQVIPWTVNDPGDMHRLLAWGVDGLITDYPDVAVEVLAELGVAVRPGSSNGR